jgi:hypothetical protein
VAADQYFTARAILRLDGDLRCLGINDNDAMGCNCVGVRRELLTGSVDSCEQEAILTIPGCAKGKS